MKTDEIQNLDDFTCFLLTYIAEANYRISIEEKDIILKHVSQEKYEIIKRFIDNRSDFELLDLIDYYNNEFLSTPEQRKALIHEMYDLASADGHHSALERNLILALQKIIKA